MPARKSMAMHELQAQAAAAKGREKEKASQQEDINAMQKFLPKAGKGRQFHVQAGSRETMAWLAGGRSELSADQPGERPVTSPQPTKGVRPTLLANLGQVTEARLGRKVRSRRNEPLPAVRPATAPSLGARARDLTGGGASFDSRECVLKEAGYIGASAALISFAFDSVLAALARKRGERVPSPKLNLDHSDPASQAVLSGRAVPLQINFDVKETIPQIRDEAADEASKQVKEKAAAANAESAPNRLRSAGKGVMAKMAAQMAAKKDDGADDGDDEMGEDGFGLWALRGSHGSLRPHQLSEIGPFAVKVRHVTRYGRTKLCIHQSRDFIRHRPLSGTTAFSH
jgi:hypothetical protein